MAKKKVSHRIGYCHKCRGPMYWHVPNEDARKKYDAVAYCETCDDANFWLGESDWALLALINKLTRLEEIFIRDRKR